MSSFLIVLCFGMNLYCLNGDIITIKSVNYGYVSVTPPPTYTITANSGTPDFWFSHFDRTPIGPAFTLRTRTGGTYFGTNGPNAALEADYTSVGIWQQFRFTQVSHDIYQIQTIDSRFWTAQMDGTITLTNAPTHASNFMIDVVFGAKTAMNSVDTKAQDEIIAQNRYLIYIVFALAGLNIISIVCGCMFTICAYKMKTKPKFGYNKVNPECTTSVDA
mmetsp:Transcript_39524/g.48913  ORF Transcript_39524/g.48913 Transcript_39524/m.48913 type:complete len:218 (+) Transcript_39524:52-705(+)